MNKQSKNSGIGSIGLLAGVAVIAIIGVIAWAIINKTNDSVVSSGDTPTKTSETAMTQSSTLQTAPDNLTYTDDVRGFEFTYPKTWRLQARDSLSTNPTVPADHVRIITVANEAATFADVNDYLSVKQGAIMLIDVTDTDQTEPELDPRVDKSLYKTIDIDGETAYYRVYSDPSTPYSTNSTYLFVHDGTHYTVNIRNRATDASTQSTYQKQMEQVLDSIKF